jgi:[calcium/calmodulin-dependent protein kinase] kinase
VYVLDSLPLKHKQLSFSSEVGAGANPRPRPMPRLLQDEAQPSLSHSLLRRVSSQTGPATPAHRASATSLNVLAAVLPSDVVTVAQLEAKEMTPEQWKALAVAMMCAAEAAPLLVYPFSNSNTANTPGPDNSEAPTLAATLMHNDLASLQQEGSLRSNGAEYMSTTMSPIGTADVATQCDEVVPALNINTPTPPAELHADDDDDLMKLSDLGVHKKPQTIFVAAKQTLQAEHVGFAASVEDFSHSRTSHHAGGANAAAGPLHGSQKQNRLGNLGTMSANASADNLASWNDSAASAKHGELPSHHEVHEHGEDIEGYSYIQNENERYTFLWPIGQGSHGQVHLVQNEPSESSPMTTAYAMKIVKQRLSAASPMPSRANTPTAASMMRHDGGLPSSSQSPETQHLRAFQMDDKAFSREVAMMKKIKHDNVVRLHTVMADKSRGQLLLLMEYMVHGPIMKLQPNGKAVPFSESAPQEMPLKVAAAYLRHISAGVLYLHNNNIVHNDIKPSNILVGADKVPKLSDFGMSELAEENMVASNFGGTRSFAAPEICGDHDRDDPEHTKVNGPALDMWALGVTAFIMVTGYHPFACGLTDRADAQEELARRIHGTLCYPPSLTPDCRGMLERLLDPNPTTRMTCKQMRDHPFIGRRTRIRAGNAVLSAATHNASPPSGPRPPVGSPQMIPMDCVLPPAAATMVGGGPIASPSASPERGYVEGRPSPLRRGSSVAAMMPVSPLNGSFLFSDGDNSSFFSDGADGRDELLSPTADEMRDAVQFMQPNVATGPHPRYLR